MLTTTDLRPKVVARGAKKNDYYAPNRGPFVTILTKLSYVLNRILEPCISNCNEHTAPRYEVQKWETQSSTEAFTFTNFRFYVQHHWYNVKESPKHFPFSYQSLCPTQARSTEQSKTKQANAVNEWVSDPIRQSNKEIPAPLPSAASPQQLGTLKTSPPSPPPLPPSPPQ